ncbi:hypothetical protein NQ317_009905, partial [Molorchus minor]
CLIITLPSKEQFYVKLNKVHIADEDYERPKTFWNMFSCRILEAYSDLYLKTEVLLLCDKVYSVSIENEKQLWNRIQNPVQELQNEETLRRVHFNFLRRIDFSPMKMGVILKT